MSKLIVAHDFYDWDNIKVLAGTEADELLRRGYQAKHKKWFYNLIKGGKVVAVTLGKPPLLGPNHPNT